MDDTTTFPHPVYRDTVLAPLFEGVKAHHADDMAQINRAHLVMLAETGILGRDNARAIAKALTAIESDVDVPALTYTGEFEDYFFVVEAALKERLGDLGGALHTARSRNDMDHTLFKLSLMTLGTEMARQLAALAKAMIETARRESDTLIVAYTHGQPAQPTTYGHYLAAIAEVTLRDLDRLLAALDTVELCPMGAAAITTSGFPIDRAQMADLLGFRGPLINSYGCIASVDYVTGLYSAIKLVFVHLGRLCQDFQYWAAFEVGQLYVPNALVQISSIMPQKRNPVPIEHMRHMASLTAGRCDAIVDVMRNTPFTDMNDSEGAVQSAGYAAFDSGSAMLTLLAAFIPASQINPDRVRANTDAACITITELADTVVRDEGLSFRRAHEIAAATARAVIALGQPLGEGFAAFSEAFTSETGRASSMDEAGFREAVAPETFVARRTRLGGPAPEPLHAALEGYRDDLARLTASITTRIQRRKDASDRLASAFAALRED